MSKAKELQAEISRLRNDRDSWKRAAEMRLTTIQSYQKAQTELYQKLSDEKSAAARELVEVATTITAKAVQSMDALRQEAELAIVSAERDAVAKALRYTIDNLTARS